MTQPNSLPETAPSDKTPTQASAAQDTEGPNGAHQKLPDPEENTHQEKEATAPTGELPAAKPTATQDIAATSTIAEPSKLHEHPPQKHITEAVRQPSTKTKTEQPEEREEQPKELANVLDFLKAAKEDPPQEHITETIQLDEEEEQPKELPDVGDLIMVVHEDEIPLIFSGKKTMELRGRKVKLGPTWVAVEGYIYGQVLLVKAQQLTKEEFQDMRDQHRWPLDNPPRSKNLYGISFIQPKKFTEPIPFFRQPRRSPWALFRRHENDLPRPSSRTGQKPATSHIQSVQAPMTPFEPPPTPRRQSRRKRKSLPHCKGESDKN